MEAGDDVSWSRDTVPKVLQIVSTRLPQRDLISLLLVSPWFHSTLISHPSLWLLIDFREMSDAGSRLIAALSLPRYRHVKQSNLEFAQGIEDGHFEVVRNKCSESLQNLEVLNLNSCQNISDKGVEDITSACTNLKVFSIYWNVRYCRVTDIGIAHLVKSCKYIIDLNIRASAAVGLMEQFSGRIDEVMEKQDAAVLFWSGDLIAGHQFSEPDVLSYVGAYNNEETLLRFVCKSQNLSDKSLQLVAQTYPELESLNLTRCVKLTDFGLQQILNSCSTLQSLNLYALSSFTDDAYKKISLLAHLKFLDLCGAQNVSDEGLSSIARCNGLLSLNLTWCVRVTDVGGISIAENCTSLEYLSLFGILGVTDACLDFLSRSCSNTVTTLDVNGCIGIKRRSRGELLEFFPKIKCFKVHS